MFADRCTEESQALESLALACSGGHLNLDDASSNSARSLEDWDKAAVSSIGAGLDVQLTKSRGPFNLGIRTKLSYRAMTSTRVQCDPDERRKRRTPVVDDQCWLGVCQYLGHGVCHRPSGTLLGNLMADAKSLVRTIRRPFP